MGDVEGVLGFGVQITDTDHIDRLMSCLNMALPFYVVCLCFLVNVHFFLHPLPVSVIWAMSAAVSPSLQEDSTERTIWKFVLNPTSLEFGSKALWWFQKSPLFLDGFVCSVELLTASF